MKDDRYFTPSRFQDWIDEVIDHRNQYSLDIIKTVTKKEDWDKLSDVNNHVAYKNFVISGLGDINDYLELESGCQNTNMSDVVNILIAVKGGVYREFREGIKKGGSNW